MIAKLKSKPVLIGIIAFVVVALAMAFAIPSFAAGGQPANIPPGGPNKDITRVEGNVVSVDSTKIVINTTGTPAQVTLALDKNTNFALHGVDWITSGALVGKPVTAIYKNGQTVTPPVAAQIMIDMPAPPAAKLAQPPMPQNIAKIQGTLTVNTDGSVTIGNVPSLKLDKNTNLTLYGISSLAGANGKTANAIYNTQTNTALQVMVNLPAEPSMPPKPRPAPGDPKAPPKMDVTRVQGTLTLNGGSIVVAPVNSGTPVTLALGAATMLTLHGVTSLVDGQTVMAVYNNGQTGTPVASMVMVNMPQPTFNAIGPKGNMGGGFPPKGPPPFRPGPQKPTQ